MQPGGKGESNCQLTDCTGGCCIWRTKAQLAHCYAALPSYLREPLNCAARSSLPVESFRAKCLLRRAAKHTRSRCSPFFVCFYFLLRALPLYHIHLSSIIICIYIYIYFIYIWSNVGCVCPCMCPGGTWVHGYFRDTYTSAGESHRCTQKETST